MVRWSPDGRKLLFTHDDGDPDKHDPGMVDGESLTPVHRTGCTVLDLDSGQTVLHPLEPDGNDGFMKTWRAGWTSAFGLAVTRDRQYVWLGEPNGRSWDLPA